MGDAASARYVSIEFNLNPDFTDEVYMKFRWSRKHGITINYNNTDEYRTHFLHWSLWKYIDKNKVHDKLLKAITSKIRDIDCFEFISLPRGGFKVCED